MSQPSPRVGVGVVVIRQGLVLLKGSHGSGHLGASWL